MAVAGHGCANLVVTTPLEHALQTAGPSLETNGWRRLRFDADLLILRDILARLPQPDAESPLSGDIGPGLLRALLRTLRALRVSGVNPSALRSKGVHELKSRSLAEISFAFDEAIVKQRLFDDAIIYREGVRLLRPEHSTEEGPTPPLVAIMDEVSLARLACDYVTSLAGGNGLLISPVQAPQPAPVQSAAARLGHWPRPQSAHAGPPRSVLNFRTARSITVAEAFGAETEVRGVIRRILSDQAALDTVEIAYTSERPYLHLLTAAAQRFDLPATFGAGIPGELTRPGRALSRFLRWIRRGLPADDLVDLCRSGLLDEQGGRPPGTAVARVLRDARIHAGRGQYLAGLQRLLHDAVGDVDGASSMGSGDPADAKGEGGGGRRGAGRLGHDQIQESAERVRQFLDLVPEGKDVSLGSLIEGLVRFLTEQLPYLPTESEAEDILTTDDSGSDEHAVPDDVIVIDTYVDRLESISRSVTWVAPLPDLVGFVEELLKSHKAEATSATHGRMNVVPLERAGYAGRSRLFVLGLDEATFPGGGAEDPILLDAERAAVSAELQLRRTQPAARIWHLDRLLHTDANITLVVSRRNIAEARELYPSPYLAQIEEQLSVTRIQLPLVPDQGDQGIEEFEALLPGRRALDYGAKVLEVFPWLGKGEIASRARTEQHLGRFDGWVGGGNPELDPRYSHHVLSASRLETLVRCPYRYFLHYVLHVIPPDETLPDPTRWLTPLAFGSLLHDLFRDFMAAVHESGEGVDVSLHSDLMNRLLRESVDRCRERIPVTHEDAYLADYLRLQSAARLFLASEAVRKGREPMGFEVSFGFGEHTGLSQNAPVKIELSDSSRILLRGRIDRVDRVTKPAGSSAGVGDYEIWDYKTGSARSYDENEMLGGGLNLQWALYAYALQEILEGQGRAGSVVESGYFFPSDREHGRRMSGPPPNRTDVGHLLTPLFEMARLGAFFHIQKTRNDQCLFCDYASLCRSEHRLARSFEPSLEATLAAVPDPNDAPGTGSPPLEVVGQLQAWHRSSRPS